jgi:hypothetical protein
MKGPGWIMPYGRTGPRKVFPVPWVPTNGLTSKAGSSPEDPGVRQLKKRHAAANEKAVRIILILVVTGAVNNQSMLINYLSFSSLQNIWPVSWRK